MGGYEISSINCLCPVCLVLSEKLGDCFSQCQNDVHPCLSFNSNLYNNQATTLLKFPRTQVKAVLREILHLSISRTDHAFYEFHIVTISSFEHSDV